MSVAASAETHTHTAPPRPVTKVPLHAWGRGGHALATTQTAALLVRPSVFICAEFPAPLIVLAVIMAATRQHPVAIWAGSQSLWKLISANFQNAITITEARAALPAGCPTDFLKQAWPRLPVLGSTCLGHMSDMPNVA